jgi:hypothetical protein
MEMRNPSEWRRKSTVEAASGLNDGLGGDGAKLDVFGLIRNH